MGKSSEQFLEQREAEQSELSTYSLATKIARRTTPTELSKASAEGNAEQIAELVRNGEASALDVATKLAWIISTCEQARKLIQQDSVDEIEKHNGKTEINGAEVIKKETGVKYNYESCNDPEWNIGAATLTAAKNVLSEREKFLKTLTKPITVVDETTAEVHQINPPQKSSTTNIQISFK